MKTKIGIGHDYRCSCWNLATGKPDYSWNKCDCGFEINKCVETVLKLKDDLDPNESKEVHDKQIVSILVAIEDLRSAYEQ